MLNYLYAYHFTVQNINKVRINFIVKPIRMLEAAPLSRILGVSFQELSIGIIMPLKISCIENVLMVSLITKSVPPVCVKSVPLGKSILYLMPGRIICQNWSRVLRAKASLQLPGLPAILKSR